MIAEPARVLGRRGAGWRGRRRLWRPRDLPAAHVGAILFSAADLAFSRRLFDARPSCWPVIGITAGVTAWIDPFWGLLAGGLAEIGRAQVIELLHRLRQPG